MRQGEEDDVVAREDLGRRGLDDPVGQGRQVRLQVTETGPGAASGGQRTDLDVGMVQQEPEQLAARVAGRPGDRDLEDHVHDYAKQNMSMQTRVCLDQP